MVITFGLDLDYLVCVDPFGMSQDADWILWGFWESNKILLAAKTCNLLCAMVPELPPSFVEALVRLERLYGPGWMNHFNQELVCNRPAGSDLVEASLTDIQRPPVHFRQR
jgi:hypothetical protein